MNKVTNEVLVIAERMYDDIKKEEKENDSQKML